MPGLSPRVRGNLLDTGPGLDTGRSIPACAGEPPLCFHLYYTYRVYPPRVRGNRKRNRFPRRRTRSIPACAGEPPERNISRAQFTVYPRVCGGTASGSGSGGGARGLSPRVRGNHWWNTIQATPTRSIPACAGEPDNPSPEANRTRVYPRVCGGTMDWTRRAVEALGLSPRVRGNPVGPESARPDNGSIPACAGEPLCHRAIVRQHQVYPRVCGGTVKPGGMTISVSGLSPRVRGNQRNRRPVSPSGGSIPACAGEPAAGLPCC